MATRRLRNRLPPPYSLIVFEAVARLQNFSRAAEELCVSQSAVSKQIHILEAFLNTSLLSRSKRVLVLTASGRLLYNVTRDSLGSIAEVIDQIKQPLLKDTLTVTTTIAFAQAWLIPNIYEFKAQHPDINIKVVAQDDLLDLQARDIDCAIRYGGGEWPKIEAIRVFDEHFFPVCSPTYRDTVGSLFEPKDLLRCELLHFESPVLGEADWLSWFTSQGVTVTTLKKSLCFDNYPSLIEAAILGQGLLLGATPLIDRHLNQGHLVRVSTCFKQSGYGYYIAVLAGVKKSEPLLSFCQWMLAKSNSSVKLMIA